jgi:hypothetical protein
MVRFHGRPVQAWVAQLVERVLGKDEVTGSIPVPGSSLYRASKGLACNEGTSGGNSGVESLPSKQMVAGSNPVPRSITRSVLAGLTESYGGKRRQAGMSVAITGQL